MGKRLLGVVLVVVTLLLVGFLVWQNYVASGGRWKEFGYTVFNRGDPSQANKIMNYWRADEGRKAAVQNLIRADYVFMVLYGVMLCVWIYRRLKVVSLRWVRIWLRIGFFAVIATVGIDAYQDGIIYGDVQSQKVVDSLSTYTQTKWMALVVGVVSLVFSYIPAGVWRFLKTSEWVEWLGLAMKALWTFFPSVLFLLLVGLAFWKEVQGKDILVAFAEDRPEGAYRFSHFSFFLATGFWVYVTWYSSRIIAYMKGKIGHKFNWKNVLELYPRMAGNACFLILELAVLQSPPFPGRLGIGLASALLVVGLIVFYFVDCWVGRVLVGKPWYDRFFYISLGVFLVMPLFSHLVFVRLDEYIVVLPFLLLYLHLLFVLYSNKHHDETKRNVKVKADKRSKSFEDLMDFLCLPAAETGYFVWFLVVAAVAIGFYFLSIRYLGFARGMGPFPFLLLAFGVLLGLANLISAFSIRYSVNFHFVIFILAVITGGQESHDVKKIGLQNETNMYDQRPGIDAYLRAWVMERVPESVQAYDVYFVMANGGASRSGYWTASVLGKLEDASRACGDSDRFSYHLFCLSGTSGGGVGVATFFALLKDQKRVDLNGGFLKFGQEFLKQDYFTYTLARTLGPDYLNYIFRVDWFGDRGRALERSFEVSAEADSADTHSRYRNAFGSALSKFKALEQGRVALPILFINTTRMQDGNPGVVTNIRLDSTRFNRRVDVLCQLPEDEDVSLASGAILGSRFPYLSPAGRISPDYNNYFVDGGYFDNSGAGVVQETIQAILDIERFASRVGDTAYSSRLRKLRFKVLHITNSPPELTSQFNPVPPLKNDLLSPVLTILGAYDMQTTVNDSRLYHFLRDVESGSGHEASYQQISLYKAFGERDRDDKTAETPYSINWFMSDATRNRIDRRLDSQPVLRGLLSGN